jgi:hypothetical protein
MVVRVGQEVLLPSLGCRLLTPEAGVAEIKMPLRVQEVLVVGVLVDKMQMVIVAQLTPGVEVEVEAAAVQEVVVLAVQVL